MTLAPRQSQRQHQTLSFRQLQAISILRLDNAALTQFLLRQAEMNPMMRVASAGIGLSEAMAPDLPERAVGLYGHVQSQLSLILTSVRDRELALVILDALAPTGWLDASLSQIAFESGQSVARVEDVLEKLQAGIDPAGLFARDLRECLRLQAIDRGQLDPVMAQVLDHLPRLGSAGVGAVAAECGLEVKDVTRCLATIRSMNPRPGLAFDSDCMQVREPDVIVTRHETGWKIELNRSTLPSVDLSVVPGASVSPALRSARKEALWLAGIVTRRNSTVLAIARAVLLRQSGYLDHGPTALVALSRVEIAHALGLHDSTVGRVTSELLVETPHGICIMGSLFGGTSHATLAQNNSSSVPSSAAIRQRLSELIAAEDPSHPLSDVMLADALAQEGKPLARRTVARFRQQLGIPGCATRRRPDPNFDLAERRCRLAPRVIGDQVEV